MLGFGTYGLLDDFSVLHHDQGGDAEDAELIGKLKFFIHIDLADLDVGALFCDFLHDGNHHPARAAPGGIEVQQDGFFGT